MNDNIFLKYYGEKMNSEYLTSIGAKMRLLSPRSSSSSVDVFFREEKVNAVGSALWSDVYRMQARRGRGSKESVINTSCRRHLNFIRKPFLLLSTRSFVCHAATPHNAIHFSKLINLF
jgi:hypothetical protein